jgi:hypothetical protein
VGSSTLFAREKTQERGKDQPGTDKGEKGFHARGMRGQDRRGSEDEQNHIREKLEQAHKRVGEH